MAKPILEVVYLVLFAQGRNLSMNIKTFLNGMLMGICDLVPGISGGTMAFVLGIYERLILAVSGLISFTAIDEVFSGIFSWDRAVFRKYDLGFLFTLLFGILTSLILGARIVSYLLEHYFVYTISFFIGLILSSALLIFRAIKSHTFGDYMFGVLGFVLGVLLLFLIPISVEVSELYIFFSGFIGISAMFLPGISGSYLLYILGSYETMLSAASDPVGSIGIIVVFGLGALLGALSIAKLIGYLFRHYESVTLYFLFGFVIGSLGVPLRDVLGYSLGYVEVMIGLVLFLAGMIVVLLVEK
ncbi:MAG: putative membrane protein [Patescibacteria group bacterium]